MQIKRRLITLALGAALLLFPLGARGLITLNTANQEVLMVQQRLIDTHYFAFKATGNYGGMTRNAVQEFQRINDLMADGTVGDESLNTLFSSKVLRAPILASIPIGPNLPAGQTPEVFGSMDGDWFKDIDPYMPVDNSFHVTDIITGKSYAVMRTGGVNHARVEPASREDHDIFLETFGGEYNWSKRPVIVTIGTVIHAASIQGFPDGADKVEGNGMAGSCALYFSGSLSEIGSLPDAEHRSVILKAASPDYWQ